MTKLRDNPRTDASTPGDPDAIPAPEVIESDPATTWGLWEDAVKKLDELVETRRTTQPSQLQ